MRNVKIILIIATIFVAPTLLLAQATVSHGFRQDIEISVDGKGGPTLIKQGESKSISYLPKSGNVSLRVRYKEGRRFVEKIANVKVSNGQLFLPEAPNAAVVQASATQKTNAQTQKPDQNSADHNDDYDPKVGKVNIIQGIDTKLESFPIKIVNNSGKGDLIFIGSVFTGAAIGEGDTLVSQQNVFPGLLELNVLYKKPSYDDNDDLGQSFILAQQALLFFVTDREQVIEIDGSQFFDFSQLAPNLKVRFENEGNRTLFSRPVSRPLEPGRRSKVYKYAEAEKITWHFNDANNLRRITVWNYVPESRIIRIQSFDDIFGVSR